MPGKKAWEQHELAEEPHQHVLHSRAKDLDVLGLLLPGGAHVRGVHHGALDGGRHEVVHHLGQPPRPVTAKQFQSKIGSGHDMVHHLGEAGPACHSRRSQSPNMQAATAPWENPTAPACQARPPSFVYDHQNTATKLCQAYTVSRHDKGALEGRPRAEGDQVGAAVGDGCLEGHRLEHRRVDQAPAPGAGWAAPPPPARWRLRAGTSLQQPQGSHCMSP